MVDEDAWRPPAGTEPGEMERAPAVNRDPIAPEGPGQDPTEPNLGPEGRPESEPPVEERRGTEFFGLPAMILLIAVVAVIKGIVTQQLGFTIVGAVVAGGIFAAIGLAMTIARRE